MNKTSKSSLNLIECVNRGYTISKDGEFFSPSGLKRKLRVDRGGYERFSVSTSSGIGLVKVHQFQAYMKFGERVFETQTVRHLDGNKKNNHWDNIEIGSTHDNMMDIPVDARIHKALCGAKQLRKLSEERWNEFWKDRNSGFTYRQLCEKYKISKSTVSYIVNQKTYRYY